MFSVLIIPVTFHFSFTYLSLYGLFVISFLQTMTLSVLCILRIRLCLSLRLFVLPSHLQTVLIMLRFELGRLQKFYIFCFQKIPLYLFGKISFTTLCLYVTYLLSFEFEQKTYLRREGVRSRRKCGLESPGTSLTTRRREDLRSKFRREVSAGCAGEVEEWDSTTETRVDGVEWRGVCTGKRTVTPLRQTRDEPVIKLRKSGFLLGLSTDKREVVLFEGKRLFQ